MSSYWNLMAGKGSKHGLVHRPQPAHPLPPPDPLRPWDSTTVIDLLDEPVKRGLFRGAQKRSLIVATGSIVTALIGALTRTPGEPSRPASFRLDETDQPMTKGEAIDHVLKSLIDSINRTACPHTPNCFDDCGGRL